jgi:aspartate aminotransferase
VSQRLQQIRASATVAMTARAQALRAAGRDIISLSVGEPDFPTPPHIMAAAHAALDHGHTRYTDVAGIAPLRDAVVAKFARDNSLHYTREQVLVGTGAKQVLFNLCLALLDPGDEVIVPAPCWVSYPDMARLAGAQPIIVPTHAASGYRMSAEQLEQALTPRTRLLMLNSPCNPTGAAYARGELRALAEVLARHPRVMIATDDIYEHIWWGAEAFCSFAEAAPELYERTVTVNGCSKAYAMTGWRIGFCGGPKPLIDAMITLQGQSTTSATTIAQYAALAALTGDLRTVRDMNQVFRARHDWLIERLNALPGVQCRPGQGTFYAFPDVREAVASLGLADDTALAEHLLEHAGVATVAGSGFAAPGHLRLSFASAQPVLESAMERIAGALRARR